MIERIYLDNIRTFVNFEWRPGPVAVLLGANGTGKTALLDTLRNVQTFLRGEASTTEAFSAESRTRWDRRREQTIELDVRGPAGVYRYRLVIAHDDRDSRPRVVTESLRHEGAPLIEIADRQLQLYREDGGAGSSIKAPVFRSGVAMFEPPDDGKRYLWFKEWLLHLWILRPDPRTMISYVERKTAGWLAQDLSNFASWYIHRLASQQRAMFKASEAIGEVLPGFLELHESGGYLHARFGDDASSTSYRMDELSDGQRALIALYVLRHAVAGAGRTLVIDEPDNYISLREIQPWLAEMLDLALTEGGLQLWLISHHPEVLNLLALDHGWRFYRDGSGPTRIERFQPAAGLDPAETVALGWDHAS